MPNPIKHIVVVMLENRSYDNILGGLYINGGAPAGQTDLNGLTGSESNVNPNDSSEQWFVNNQTSPTSLGGSDTTWPATTIPLVDPGELFVNMAQQITGSYPSTNPYASYTQADGLMSGFTSNYVWPKGAVSETPSSNLPDVMNYFSPEQLPVTAFLAKNYGVCDQWFASVPTQTFTNRVFALCAAPGIGTQKPELPRGRCGEIFSWIDDLQYLVADTTYALPSVFSVLDAALGKPAADDPQNWKVYFHDYSISMMTVPYVASSANGGGVNVNVSTFDDSDWGTAIPKQLNGTPPNTFVEDASAGTLPLFSFIEPRYSNNYAANHLQPNSNHPGASAYGLKTEFGVTNGNPPIDVSSGEYFLMQVYNLLQGSSSWNETLLIVTYDEAGGTYDHQPPPLATPPAQVGMQEPSPPFPNIPAACDPLFDAVNGFNFNVFGCRVPAIIISPWITPGSTIRAAQPFDHTSIIRTVLDTFLEQKTSLTSRDAAAPSLIDCLAGAPSATTAPFGGVILPCPSSLVFEMHHDDTATQTILVSAGSTIPLTVSAMILTTHDDRQWLSISSTSGTDIAIRVTASASGIWTGTFSGQIEISGAGLTSITIPVTLIVKLL